MPEWKQEIRRQLPGLNLAVERETAIVDELSQHLDDCYAELLAGGVSETEAYRRTLAELSGSELLQRELRRIERQRNTEPVIFGTTRRNNMTIDLWQDLRYGVRALLKAPGFTLIAVITLALGIGASTAIFSVVNAVLLKPLPFADSERLVMVWNHGAPAAGGDRTPLAVADLLDWRAQSKSFAEIGAYQWAVFNYTDGETPERVQAANVTANFFSLLGVQAQLGRTFLPEEERPGAQRVLVLGDGLWRRRFAADPQILGQTLNLNGTPFTVIGVAPAALDFPSREIELWTALQVQTPTRRGPYYLTGVARLRPGATLAQVRAEVNAMKSSFDNGQFTFNVLTVNDFIVGDVRLALLVLLSAVTLVLLIAAVNVANLMLVRSAGRVREISIRAALGASRARIVRQLLTESLLLAFAGGLLGAALATWGVRLLLKTAPETIPRLGEIGIDAQAFGWTALVTLLTGILFGLAPAWQSARTNLNEALKEGGRGTTESPGRKRWRSALVVAELALAVTLMIGAGLLLKSFWRLQHVDPGVNTERVLTMRLAPRGQQYREAAQVIALYERLLARLETLPGVRSVALSNGLPPDSTEYSDGFQIQGRPSASDQHPPIAYMIHASRDYFAALNLPLRRGRYFNAADSADAPCVMLVNETTARRFFANEDALGQRINRSSEREPRWCEIVGVVGDAKYNGLADDVQPAIYQHLPQAPSWNVFLLIRTEGNDPLSLAAAVRNEIGSIDPGLPVSRVETLEHRFDIAVAQPRFRTTLIALFAALALALAAVGIYGVISYSVSQRTHEVGVRMALGAQKGDVVRMVLGDGARLAGAGVLLGLGASFALTGMLETLLFDVSATDWTTFGGISVLLAAVALLACWLPARRAARVDPMIALRSE
ncbi:MAG: ABC transporter permease [Blastocatellales bacterium]|nr:ABC transporter permease [Blastocatellales bacterium]